MKFFLITAFVLSSYRMFGQTIDSIAIKQVDSLILLSRTLTGQQNFDKALEVNAAAEKIALEKLGKESAACGSAYLNRGRIAHKKRDYPEAEKWYLESIAIQEKALGNEHPNYALSLDNLAVLYMAMSNYPKAEPLLSLALAIREKALGKEHPDFTSNLNKLGLLYFYMGNYEKAEPFYLEAIEIRERTLGKEHSDYAASLNNLAILYNSMGNYEKAELLYLEAKNIREKTFGKEHPDYAASLNNLAILYYNMGNYEKAEPLYLEAKVIFEKAFGKESSDYASSLNNLGYLYYRLGQYEKAEPLYLESKAVREKVLGKESPEYAMSLNNLAVMYSDIGYYDKAEILHLEAKAFREKTLGKEHPDYAWSLCNLAVLYYRQGQYEKAEPLYLESINILGKTLGKEHPDYASNLNNLAALYFDMAKYKKAEPLYLESISIQGKTLGKEHPDYAQSLDNLANLYYYGLGNYTKAESLYLESKATRRKILGKEHPDYAASIINLTSLYEGQNRFSESEALFTELLAIEQARLLKSTAILSEGELAVYTATFQKRESNLGGYLFNRMKYIHEGTLPALAFDHTLFFKGFLLTVATQLNALKASTPESQEISLRLKSYRRRLATEYTKPIAERKNVAELEEKANATEKQLARTVPGYADALQQVKWQEVQNSLKVNESAIEFIHFNVNFPKKTDSIMYAALLLKPTLQHPLFIPLFEEKSLDSILQSKGERRLEYVNDLYSFASRGATALEAKKRSLAELIFKPLEKELTGINTIYYSPSGLLHRINLDAIAVSETETLADRYNLVELNSTRQLVIPSVVKNTTNDAVLFGGIQFNADSTILSEQPMLASRTESQLSFNQTNPNSRGGSWDYLPGTEREVNAIEKIMTSGGIKTTLKKGYDGTEEAFKNIGANNSPSPRILHIATHGYFFPDPKAKNSKNTLGNDEPVFKISDLPMLRSGLILAGGNNTWKGEKTLEGREDGILTAYEISQMNLSNTELVVLSACETGLGEINGNEGVYGLQRAFKIAGAKYLIMSLWQVPDKQTSLLMTTFYKKWLEEKMSIPEAFHAAQKDLKDVGLDPYYWAGFVLVE